MNDCSIDQKLKAFEIASRLITTDGPGENSSQEEFSRHMDEYFSTVAGFAELILRKVASIQG